MNITDQIRRLVRIVNKVRRDAPISKDELIAYICRDLGYREQRITQRTLQRDLNIIATLFNISITFNRGVGGYVIENNDNTSKEYEILLQNFELLSRINQDSVLLNCVIHEHRLPPLGDSFAEILTAIRSHNYIEFNYKHYRNGNKLSRHTIAPHFLKESQQRWYVIGYNSTKQLRVYALERISNVDITTKFKPQPTEDIMALFAESFGIWADESIPIEDIVLKYDNIDGAFVKSLPLHQSQRIIAEDDNSVTVGLRLRITNDFVMALLSRSRSIEVIEPLSLRERMESIYRDALQRNKSVSNERMESI